MTFTAVCNIENAFTNPLHYLNFLFRVSAAAQAQPSPTQHGANERV